MASLSNPEPDELRIRRERRQRREAHIVEVAMESVWVLGGFAAAWALLGAVSLVVPS